jgi:menaquinone-9 beta-reductase
VIEAREAVVVGAGPSGAAAAAVLAAAGRRPLVLEKDRFPRSKVCGEFLSGSARESLVRLDVLAAIAGEAAPVERGAVNLRGGRTVRFELASRGFGISRDRLDALLADRARALGTEVRFGCRVVGLEPAPGGTTRIRFAGAGGREEAVVARGVVGAWGRWDALDRALDRRFLAARSRFFGWSRDYENVPSSELDGEVRLYVFPGGYCGLSRVERRTVRLAGVIAEHRRRRLAVGWDAVLGHARRANPTLDRDLALLDGREAPGGDLGTGPVYFTSKRPVEAGALMTGDAAGVLDLFLGEGISAALASGILAGDTLEAALAGRIALENVGDEYARAWKERFSERIGWGFALRRLMLHPGAAAVAARFGGEGLVRLALTRLAI